MSLRTARALAVAASGPRRDRRPSWGDAIEVGARVTSFGHHGVGQPAIDGDVKAIDGQHVTVATRHGDRVRTISNLRRVGA